MTDLEKLGWVDTSGCRHEKIATDRVEGYPIWNCEDCGMPFFRDGEQTYGLEHRARAAGRIEGLEEVLAGFRDWSTYADGSLAGNVVAFIGGELTTILEAALKRLEAENG